MENPGAGTLIRSYSSTMDSNGGLNARSNHARSDGMSILSGGPSESGDLADKPSLDAKLSTDDGGASGGGGARDGDGHSLLRWTIWLLLGGTSLGLALPTNPRLPSRSWRVLSNVVGYTYFMAWSVSFYPQILLNYRRRTTRGLSVDFCVLNVLGYVCYTVYTTNFYWNWGIIRAYRDRMSNGGIAGDLVAVDEGDDGEAAFGTARGVDIDDNDESIALGNGADITVQGNDVAFAIHALLMASVTLSQIGIYDSFVARPPSRRACLILLVTFVYCVFYMCFNLAVRGRLYFLGFLYVLGSIKICVTVGKYVPQVLLNRSRKSTVGWNVWNVILDLTGGVLSLLQLVGDCADMGNWDGITGNPAKIALALVTICFDLIFLVQHYILYPDADDKPSYSPLPTTETMDAK